MSVYHYAESSGPACRTVLRSIGLTGLAAAGLSGGAAADATQLPGNDEAQRERVSGTHNDLVLAYGSPSTVTRNVEEPVHSRLVAGYRSRNTLRPELEGAVESVLEKLVELGHLERASLDVFDLDEVYEDGRVLSPGDSGVSATVIRHGDTTTSHLMTGASVNGHEIGLYHQPEAGNTYALVHADGDGVVVHDMGEDGDVGVDSDCSNDYYCGNDVCCTCQMSNGLAEYTYEVKERCCLMADGTYECSTTNVSGSCPCQSGAYCC